MSIAPPAPEFDAASAAAPPGARPDAPGAPLLSVVVPVRNEGPNVLPLVGEIHSALSGVAHEIVYVDDGSTDDTAERLREAARTIAAASAPGGASGGASGGVLKSAPLVLRRHRAGCGQSAAIVTGVRAARGEWVATLDGDGQNDPADIPALFDRARREAPGGDGGYVLVVGHRTRRRDGAVKRITSRAANRIRAGLLGDATPDTGCGLKLFRRADFLDLPRFDHMHRYLPALFLRAGGRVVSVPVNHRPRLRGRSKYGTLDRLWAGLFDLAGVYWLQRRWRRPQVETLQAEASPGRGDAPGVQAPRVEAL